MKRLWSMIRLIGFFLKELVVANLQVAVWIVRGPQQLQPAIVTFPTALKSDFEVMLLANMITLTPGTLTLDIVDSGRTLVVHVLHSPSPEQTVISIRKGFESMIREAFSA